MRFNKICFFLFFLTSQMLFSQLTNDDAIARCTIGTWSFKAGDSLYWANPSYNSSKWEKLGFYRHTNIGNKNNGNFWFRANFFIKDSTIVKEDVGVFRCFAFNAYEIYWDGVLIKKNGVVGNDWSTEKSGEYCIIARIPSELLKRGNHIIAIRTSNHNFIEDNNFGEIKIASIPYLYNYVQVWSNQIIVILVLLLISSIFSLLIYFSLDKKISNIVFSLFCLMHSVKMFYKYQFISENVTMEYFAKSYSIIDFTSFLALLFLLLYLIFEFNLPKKIIFSSVSLLISFSSVYLFSSYYLLFSTVFTLLLVFYAYYLRRKNTSIAMIGLIGYSICVYLGYLDKLNWGYFIGIFFFISCMYIVAFREYLRQKKVVHESEMRSSRLENQLLKKNIQPHFLMNSLISLQELIETAPLKASKMIDNLAKEFHLFTKFSEQQLIPLKEEILLCEAHLRIMELRKEAVFKFEQKGLDGSEVFPPAVLHTLIENGITHGYGSKNEGHFILEKTLTKSATVYRLFNDGDLENYDKLYSNGTGLKYVEARLEESYPKRWEMSSNSTSGGWEVIISIYNVSKKKRII